jgi:hypothetical protein
VQTPLRGLQPCPEGAQTRLRGLQARPEGVQTRLRGLKPRPEAPPTRCVSPPARQGNWHVTTGPPLLSEHEQVGWTCMTHWHDAPLVHVAGSLLHL